MNANEPSSWTDEQRAILEEIQRRAEDLAKTINVLAAEQRRTMLVTRTVAFTSIALAIVVATISPTPKPGGALAAVVVLAVAGVVLACSQAAMPRGGVR